MLTLVRFGNSRLRTVHEFTVGPRELAIAEMEIARIILHYAIRTLVRKSLEMVNTTRVIQRPGMLWDLYDSFGAPESKMACFSK